MLLDIALLLVIAIFTFKYYKRGLAVSLLSVGRVVCALAVTILFGGMLSTFLRELFVEKAVFEAVSSLISSFEFEKFVADNDGFISVAGILSNFGVVGVDHAALSEALSRPLSVFASGVLGYSGLFISVVLLFSLLIRAVELVKVPVLEGIDRLFGAAFGFSLATVLSVVTVALIYSALIAAKERFGLGEELLDVFDQSMIFKLVYYSGSQGILDGLN